MASSAILDNRSLTTAINSVIVPDPFVTGTFFKEKVQHSSDKIDIEVYSNSDRLAQFVGPNDSAKPILKTSKKVQTITLPRTFEKKVFSANELADYKSLGNIYIDNPQARAKLANDWVLREIENLKNRIIRRREQLACEAISTGAISVSESDIAFTADFGYVSTVNTVTLASTKRWVDSGINPLADLRKWKSLIMKRSGFNADTVLLGSDAADAFLSNTFVVAAFEASNYRIGAIDLNTKASISGNYLGTVLGMNFYEYNQQYTNSSSVVTDMITSKLCVVGSTQAPNRLHFGPMFRTNGGNLSVQNTEILLEAIEDNDHTVIEWKAEQKSLPTIHVPDSFISATVLA